MTQDHIPGDDTQELPVLSEQEQRRRERLDTLFRTHYHVLYEYARFQGTREPADTHDALQTTFFTLLTQHGELLDDLSDPVAQAQQARAVRGYLYGSLRGRMKNTRRNRTSRARLSVSAARALHSTSLGMPDEDAEAAELSCQARAAYRLLSRQEQRVFRCLRIDGLTRAETAALLGVSLGTVQVFLDRAMDKMGSALALWRSEHSSPVSSKSPARGLSHQTQTPTRKTPKRDPR